ncbi:hypothetical protein A3Q56_03897 [Intoshia linei]|uniref:Death domain-containing protein n=1 Tax=Intoshia linei TaxID=1819745 RepID=A0A177B2J1_9BILA|nr:hypothetical protein A3Q56_03897 [Intoshia linei]
MESEYLCPNPPQKLQTIRNIFKRKLKIIKCKIDTQESYFYDYEKLHELPEDKRINHKNVTLTNYGNLLKALLIVTNSQHVENFKQLKELIIQYSLKNRNRKNGIIDSSDLSNLSDSFSEPVFKLPRINDSEFNFDKIVHLGIKNKYELIEKCHNFTDTIDSIIPGRMVDIGQKINILLAYMSRFCSSLQSILITSQINNDNQDQCATNPEDMSSVVTTYTNQCDRDYSKINMHVSESSQIMEKFIFGKLNGNYFEEDGRDTYFKFNSSFSHILATFPEVAYRLRHSVSLLERWIEEDKNYVDYLNNDLKKLKFFVEHDKNLMNHVNSKCVMKLYRISKFQKSIATLIQAEKRYHMLKEDINEIEEDRKVIEFDMELNKHRLKSMLQQKKSIQLTGTKSQLSLSRTLSIFPSSDMGNTISSMCINKPTIIENDKIEKSRALHLINIQVETMNDINSNLTKKYIEINKKFHHKQVQLKREKKDYKKLEILRNKLCNEQNSLNVLENEKLQQCANFSKSTKQYLSTKTIIFYKNSQQVLKRIYLRKPIVFTKYDPKFPDNLDKAINITAESLNLNWKKLYEKLPFRGNRGDMIIDNDLINIYNKKEMCKNLIQCCLEYWRNVNRGVNVDDLKIGLKVLKRNDIIEKFNKNPQEKIIRRKKSNDKLTNIYQSHFYQDNDNKYLKLNNLYNEKKIDLNETESIDMTPYLKMIETFDALRAIGKI